jgi:DNA-binding NarL/FixJ family response regulator
MLMSNPKGLDINTYTEGIDAGAVCLIPKFILRGDKLAQYVRDAYNGVEIPPPPGVAQRMARLWHAARPLAPVGGTEVELTKRELDILRLLPEYLHSELSVGEIIGQIGSQLHLSANTVRFHKQQMAEKLGVPSDIKSLVQEGLRRRLIGG